MIHNSPFYKGKLMRWRAKRADFFKGCIQGPQAKKMRFQRGDGQKMVLWRIFGAQIICK